MFTKQQLAAAAAAVLVASPALAADPFADQAPGVMFFFSVPLDAKTPKQQTPALGLSFQGERAYQRVTIDTRMFAAYERMGFTGLEAVSAKWIIAGVVAAGATVAVASKDKSTSQQRQEQQQQQQVQQQQEQQNQQNGGGNVPCPQVCAFTGRWF
ncbi:MAG TPA: hypothetical protein VFU24_14425 [Burkholderiales bacterium]|nr:hypothetical protein [Burkholderiales bacterium]